VPLILTARLGVVNREPKTALDSDEDKYYSSRAVY